MTEFECGMPGGGRRYTIASVQDLEEMLADLQQKHPHAGDISLLVGMRVCPRPLFDQFSLECWSLYQELKAGMPLPWLYYRAPAVFMVARRIIMAEEMQIQQEKAARNAE